MQNVDSKFKNKYRIKSTRLPYWDYSQNGLYFITICTKNRENNFGEIIEKKCKLNDFGLIAQNYWLEIPRHFNYAHLDDFVIMPNHIHGIIIIDKPEFRSPNVEKRHCPVEKRQCLFSTLNIVEKPIARFQNQGKNTISSIIGSYKSICSKTIHKIETNTFFQWQSGFYDHIIKNENSLERIKQYISNNPVNWETDEMNNKFT